MKVVQIFLLIVVCVLSGMAGAYLMMHMTRTEKKASMIQTQRLELTDSNGKVRATFSVDGGQVALRMLSQEGQPVLSLTVDQDRESAKRSAGSIEIHDDSGKPLITMHSVGQERAQVAISGPSGDDQVSLGYSPYGDVIDGHERGMWGLQVKGPGHSSSGINVFSEDGALKGFNIPLTPPQAPTK
jgi:hypothetical protein